MLRFGLFYVLNVSFGADTWLGVCPALSMLHVSVLLYLDV